MSGSVWSSYFRSQLFYKPAAPTHQFTSQAIIVTGSNTGMGLAAAQSFVALGAARVILAVRSETKGQAAKASIEKATSCGPDVVEVWQLDLASEASIAAFARRADAQLDRLDVVVGNAGIMPYQPERLGQGGRGLEATVMVNVVGSLLFGMLMLKKLRETSVKLGGRPGVLTFTGSWTHALTNLDWLEGSSAENGGVFEALSKKAEKAEFLERYTTSKLAQMLAIRSLADAATASTKPGEVIISVVNPGGVKTDITRGATGMNAFVNWATCWSLRSAEVGGRTLVHAAAAAQETGPGKGRDTHGAYLDDCAVASPGECVTSEKGVAAQKLIWKELVDTMASMDPATVSAI